MKTTGDPAIATAMEFERATLGALQALEGTDTEAKRAACLRYVKAVRALRDLRLNERERAGQHLVQRGMIPDGAAKLIQAAMDALSRD